MQPKTTTIPIIENMERHPRRFPDSLLALAAAFVVLFEVRLEGEGFISRRSDSRSLPAVATVEHTSASTRKRSPHHEISEWCSTFHKVSAVVATIIGLAECSTARNSCSLQHPRKLSASSRFRSVCAAVRRKGTTDCGPCLERNSSSPSTRIRSNPKPRCDFSIPAIHSFSRARVRRCEGIPVLASRQPYIGAPEPSWYTCASSNKTVAPPTVSPYSKIGRVRIVTATRCPFLCR